MSDINEPTMPAIPEVAIEAALDAQRTVIANDHDRMQVALFAALPHLAPAPIRDAVMEEAAMIADAIPVRGSTIDEQKAAANTALDISDAIRALKRSEAATRKDAEAVAPIQGDAAGAAAPARAELVRQALIKAKLTSHDDTFVQASTREIVNAIAALPADDRIAELERERDEALALASRSTRRLAEMAEPGFIGAFAARDAAVARAEAAEAELARLQSAQPAGDRPESGEAVAVKPLEWRLRALHRHADRK